MQQFLPNQLHILGFPVSVQLFVLVTSVAPLRAYLYGEGFVNFRYGEENNYRKVSTPWDTNTRPVRKVSELFFLTCLLSMKPLSKGIQNTFTNFENRFPNPKRKKN